MSSAPSNAAASPRRLRRPGRASTIILIAAVSVVVVVAGIGLAQYYFARTPTLTIYTYSSLFGGTCGAPAFSKVFGTFATAHHVRIQVECPSGDLASTLLAQKNSPGADLVIGLDEITASQAESQGLLVPYVSPALATVPASLVRDLSPDHAVTPYEYGYLGIDYNASFRTITDGAVANSSFLNFSQNSTWARQLLYENPTTDITGEEFLAWEIEFYSAILHESWQNFWQQVLPYAPSAPDWSTAFNEFTSPPGNPLAVVSYTTDPAYAIDNPGLGAFNTTVTSWNHTLYGWQTIYGIGIVAGTQHLSLDEQFINWFLNGTVQNEIPLNEWEYPANRTVPLPSEYRGLIDPNSIVPLNEYTTPSALAANITNWQNEWQTLANQYAPP